MSLSLHSIYNWRADFCDPDSIGSWWNNAEITWFRNWEFWKLAHCKYYFYYIARSCRIFLIKCLNVKESIVTLISYWQYRHNVSKEWWCCTLIVCILAIFDNVFYTFLLRQANTCRNTKHIFCTSCQLKINRLISVVFHLHDDVRNKLEFVGLLDNKTIAR